MAWIGRTFGGHLSTPLFSNYMNISTFANECVDTNFDEKIFFEAYLKGRTSQHWSIIK